MVMLRRSIGAIVLLLVLQHAESAAPLCISQAPEALRSKDVRTEQCTSFCKPDLAVKNKQCLWCKCRACSYCGGGAVAATSQESSRESSKAAKGAASATADQKSKTTPAKKVTSSPSPAGQRAPSPAAPASAKKKAGSVVELPAESAAAASSPNKAAKKKRGTSAGAAAFAPSPSQAPLVASQAALPPPVLEVASSAPPFTSAPPPHAPSAEPEWLRPVLIIALVVLAGVIAATLLSATAPSTKIGLRDGMMASEEEDEAAAQAGSWHDHLLEGDGSISADAHLDGSSTWAMPPSPHVAASMQRAGDPHDKCAGIADLQRPPGACGSGIARECALRWRFCGADYTNGVRHASKTLSASLFMALATLFSTVALGALVEGATQHRIGLSEYLLANSLCGMAHALVGTQPLLVLRPTGPITAITIKLCSLADRLHLDFSELLAATGLCVCVLMCTAAATELSRHIAHLTAFTHEIFACFVCSIYVVDGVTELLQRTGYGATYTVEDFGLWLTSANLAILTFGLAAFLHTANSWRVLPPSVRSVLVDYDVTIAVIVTTLASYAANEEMDKRIERIELPAEISPTCHYAPVDTAAFEPTMTVRACVRAHGAGLGAHRPWIPNLVDATLSHGAMLWAVAFAAALPISFFFFMDQNISSLLCQLPVYKLRHGVSFHASFLLMGVFNLVGPCFGLPFVTGSLPHSPQFVRALTVGGSGTGGGGAGSGGSPSQTSQRHAATSAFVAENRLAPLLTYALLGLPLLYPALLEVLPRAAINGVLAYVGVEGIVQTTLWRRCLLLLTPSENFPKRLHALGARRVHAYTLLQLALLGACWSINLSPLGLCVAFLIVALVPLRLVGLPRIFTAHELDILDE